MGTRFIDRTGVRYGRLVVIQRAGTNASKKVLWECRCDCGNTTVVPSGALTTGNTTSCGCWAKIANIKHGGSNKSSYNTWRAMMRRCYNMRDKDYPHYGGAGITVCTEWHEYTNFVADMGEPTGRETLDRIDPYGGYLPSNCRWANPPVQARNIRVHTNSKSGHVGVRKYGQKWLANVTVSGKKYYSKVYSTLDEAVAARKELERKHWGVS